MTFRAVSHTAAARLAAALLAGAGLSGLAACEQRPEPHPTYESAPPPPPAPLAGDPDAAPTAAPPPSDASPPPESAEPAPPPPEAAPDAAPAPTQGLVAMAPIPNPEEPRPARTWRRAHGEAYGAWRSVPRRHRARVHSAYAPAPAVAPVHPVATRPAKAPAAVHAKPRPATVHATPKAAPPAAHERRATPAELGKAKAAHKAHGANATGANATGANATGATSADARTEALRSALSGALARGAVLSVPKMPADGAADVTLTVPADFFDTVQKEAGKQAMGDAAASANLDATLSGDGYSIIPSGAQSQPLHAGQPTVFKWTVTAVRSATGAQPGGLRADVNADLLGGGSQTLALGAVDQQGAAGGPNHWWGAALLALVVLLGLGFLLRSRAAASTPRRPVPGEVRRPFDMNNGNGDYRP